MMLEEKEIFSEPLLSEQEFLDRDRDRKEIKDDDPKEILLILMDYDGCGQDFHKRPHTGNAKTIWDYVNKVATKRPAKTAFAVVESFSNRQDIGSDQYNAGEKKNGLAAVNFPIAFGKYFNPFRLEPTERLDVKNSAADARQWQFKTPQNKQAAIAALKCFTPAADTIKNAIGIGGFTDDWEYRGNGQLAQQANELLHRLNSPDNKPLNQYDIACLNEIEFMNFCNDLTQVIGSHEVFGKSVNTVFKAFILYKHLLYNCEKHQHLIAQGYRIRCEAFDDLEDIWRFLGPCFTQSLLAKGVKNSAFIENMQKIRQGVSTIGMHRLVLNNGTGQVAHRIVIQDIRNQVSHFAPPTRRQIYSQESGLALIIRDMKLSFWDTLKLFLSSGQVQKNGRNQEETSQPKNPLGFRHIFLPYRKGYSEKADYLRLAFSMLLVIPFVLHLITRIGLIIASTLSHTANKLLKKLEMSRHDGSFKRTGKNITRIFILLLKLISILLFCFFTPWRTAQALHQNHKSSTLGFSVMLLSISGWALLAWFVILPPLMPILTPMLGLIGLSAISQLGALAAPALFLGLVAITMSIDFAVGYILESYLESKAEIQKQAEAATTEVARQGEKQQIAQEAGIEEILEPELVLQAIPEAPVKSVDSSYATELRELAFDHTSPVALGGEERLPVKSDNKRRGSLSERRKTGVEGQGLLDQIGEDHDDTAALAGEEGGLGRSLSFDQLSS